MRRSGTHLTYCLNIHPGEGLEDVKGAVARFATRVKDLVSPDEELGLGLRLSALAVEELSGNVAAFRDELVARGMYAFTVNGFPYGRFHGSRVKERVYYPDWGDPARVEYTKALAQIMAELCPGDVKPSISTVPVTYGKDLPQGAVENLAETARYLAELEERTGRVVTVALEPEPDCFLDTADDVCALWPALRGAAGDDVRYLGVCLDTCHMACCFEDPLDALKKLLAAAIPIHKIHLSSAPVVAEADDPAAILAPFVEEVYLHQTRVMSQGRMLRFPDLPPAIAAAPPGEWRVHFHVPLHYRGEGGLRTTADMLSDAFFSAAVSSGAHLEVETYTFDVLPPPQPDVTDSIAAELEWVLSRLEAAG